MFAIKQSVSSGLRRLGALELFPGEKLAPAWRYAITVALVAIAAAARHLLSPVLDGTQPYFTFYLVLILVAGWGGWRAASLAFLLSVFVAMLFFIPAETPQAILRTLTFSMVGVGLIFLTARLQRELRKLRHINETAVRDALEQKRIAATLRATEEQLNQAIRIAGLGFFDHNQVSNTLEWSPQFRNLCQFTPDEPASLDTFLARLHPDDLKAMLSAINCAHNPAGNGSFSIEFRIKLADGSIRWLNAKSQTFFEGEGSSRRPVRTLGAAADITDRKLAEEALKQSEAQFRQLAESMPQMVWITRADGSVQYVNGQWLEFTGSLDVESWNKILHPDDYQRTIALWTKCLRTGKLYEIEYRLKRASDNTYRWFLVRGHPIRDPQGNILLWFGTCTDIHDQKELHHAVEAARDELARSNIELERKVHERTAKLHEMVGELEHFSYTITHDMRAPLRAMKGFSGILLDEASNNLDASQKDMLNRISTAAERMDSLITDALGYCRAVREELPLEPINVGELLRGMIESYPQFQTPHANVQIASDLGSVMANKAGLTQCFSNYLNNAVKFVKPGVMPQIQVYSETYGTRTRFWFQDNGIGIAKNHQDKIFGMFERVNTAYEGTGIGLALVRKVAEKMQGKVGVESEVGKGSRFWIELETCPKA